MNAPPSRSGSVRDRQLWGGLRRLAVVDAGNSHFSVRCGR